MNRARKGLSLRNEFFVQILDPVTGTATFLVEVIDLIHRHLEAKSKNRGLKVMPELPATSFPRQPTDFSDYWNQYVRQRAPATTAWLRVNDGSPMPSLI
ncbi:MAG: hypothetical protein ABI233_00545 [Chthoniobacterales bacterium]